MINEKEVVHTLKHEYTKNPVANAVFTGFASRERARDKVTMPALVTRMKEEGFEFTAEQYADILKLMAKLGLGKLETDAKGRVKALKDVKVTLQSIGMAACGQAPTIDVAKWRNRFQKIPVIEAAPIKKAEEPKAVIRERVQPRPDPGVWEVLCVPLTNGGTFKTYVPKGLTKEDALRIGQYLSEVAK